MLVFGGVSAIFAGLADVLSLSKIVVYDNLQLVWLPKSYVSVELFQGLKEFKTSSCENHMMP